MSPCLQRQQHCHFSWVSIYLSIYSVNLHALLLLEVVYRVSVNQFCVLLHFNQIWYLLNDSEWVSAPQLCRVQKQWLWWDLLAHELGAVTRLRSRSRRQMSRSIFFGASIVSLRGEVADVGIFMMSPDMISQQSQYTKPQVATFGQYIEWSKGHSVSHLAGHSGVLGGERQ